MCHNNKYCILYMYTHVRYITERQRKERKGGERGRQPLTDTQYMPIVLFQHSTDPGHVFYGKHEHYQLHGSLGHLIIVVKVTAGETIANEITHHKLTYPPLYLTTPTVPPTSQ